MPQLRPGTAKINNNKNKINKYLKKKYPNKVSKVRLCFKYFTLIKLTLMKQPTT